MLVGGAMIMVKITIIVGGKPVEMTVDEARALRDQLDAVFGKPAAPVYGPVFAPAVQPSTNPWPRQPFPFEVACGVATTKAG